MSFETPILFIIFNRPEITQRVFEEIKKQKPKYLYIAADGPRLFIEEDVEKCKTTRDIVLKGIDWECELKILFRDENLGCGKAPSEAITWFFDNVEQGIILEDDCLPHASFFRYCETLLEKYKEDENVYLISGNNFQNGIKRGDASYFFSNYSHTWGWASWRRAWKHYDHNLLKLNSFKKNKLINKIDNRIAFRNYWLQKFEDVIKRDSTHIWDYQWQFDIWNNKGVTILPNVNLISNIGFGKEATHTKGASLYANMKIQDIGIILHPKNIKVNKKADRYASDKVFNIAKNKKLTYNGLKSYSKRKLVRLLAPEIIQLVKRKFKVFQNEKEQSLLNFPRYTKTTTLLENHEIIIPDSASFLFMHKEIFKEYIYNFKTLNPIPYIIDGGANIGLATIYLKLLYPSAKIIAFEPDSNIFDTLTNNINSFEFKNVELVQKGLWNENKTLSFKSEGADGGLIADIDKTVSATETIEVVSLKPYLQNQVDFLKLDIEGAETIVLKDIQDDLDRVDRIFVEYHSFVGQPQTLNEIIDILTKANFRLYMSIPGNNSLKSPLMGLGNYNNMDFQLNIFGYKENL